LRLSRQGAEVKCHQCDRPAFWSYGEDRPPLCLHCAEKLQHILNAQFLQNVAMLNQAQDDLDFIMPVAPTKGRIPVEAMARAMQRGSVLNNITVTNSNVGVLSTGDLNRIDAYISMWQRSRANWRTAESAGAGRRRQQRARQ
jgi:hypothetical protein